MGCGTSFVKYVLFFFNLVFAVAGLAMLGIGVAVLLNYSTISDVLKDNMTVAPWVFIVIGGVVFVIAFFGCCGAIRESHCMIVTYAVFLLVIIIIQVALGVLMYAYSDNVKEGLVKSVNAIFDKRSSDPAAATAFANIEEQFECCGKNSAGDYSSFSTFGGVANLPASCCPREKGVIGKTLGDTCTLAEANKVGCASKIADIYQNWNKVIASVAIGVACVEVVGALFALCLANSIRNMDRRSRY